MKNKFKLIASIVGLIIYVIFLISFIIVCVKEGNVKLWGVDVALASLLIINSVIKIVRDARKKS